MTRLALILLIPGLVAGGLWTETASGQDAPAPPLEAEIEQVLSGLRPASMAPATGKEAERLLEELRAFYRTRDNFPAWRDGEGRFPQASVLLDHIAGSAAYGLTPSAYRADELGDELAKPGSSRRDAELDVTLTRLCLVYAGHLYRGRINPREFEEMNWHLSGRKADLGQELSRALAHGNLRAALDGLAPRHPAFHELRRTLAEHRAIHAAGGWPEVPAVPGKFRAELGDSLAEIGSVRAFLRATGDLSFGPEGPEANVLDAHLQEGVRRFQARHNIGADGILGPRTMATMRIPVEEKIQTLVMNMERWRWVPDSLGVRYVHVNIPQYEMRVMEEGREVFESRVIVGTTDDETPVFTGTMTYLELNPRWNVPSSIATEEMLPKIIEDPEYLSKSRFAVIDRRTGAQVHPDSVAWSMVHPDSMTYRFRQDSGPGNSLGSIKFMFPNRFAIYLHDTPKTYLFKRFRRAFSHGCVRVDRPLDFAEYLLTEDEAWPREQIEKTIKSRKRTRVDLKDPIPVYLLYMTAYTEDDGTAAFCYDIYGHDRKLAQALETYESALSEVFAGPAGEAVAGGR